MTGQQTELKDLRRGTLEIFSAALAEVDAGKALRQRVHLEGSRLNVFDRSFNLETYGQVYAVAIGKAALKMAAALDEIVGSRITEGIIAAPSENKLKHGLLSTRWRFFRGGHPLPNQESLQAARAVINLLRRADKSEALVLFLISGGGSAIFEWPRDERITLEDLREANSVLISCGATIAEVNSVRSAFSAVKGGGLSALAPHAQQISLIVSDTNPGEESMVASGPTIAPPKDAVEPMDVISHYHLEKRLPSSVLRAVKEAADKGQGIYSGASANHYLLLDNRSAVEAARSAAHARGFSVEVASDIIEQQIEEGYAQLLSRLYEGKARNADNPFCLISGGEFACPVRGAGIGGRNSETALRSALYLDERRSSGSSLRLKHAVILSAGTDGIDGNSPAAGAIADETTVERARASGMDARRSLDESDAYTFFKALNDAIVTGWTGTNVRDLRIMIAV
jgi:hydroxypyruvate reductase